ncbi:hypothetical protein O6072_13825 [Mycolicibacterium neoaurum]|uniref:hypothetical protein n=1 Tax=Mycolicibacterium neoaurum TaxID=1795 RepID=UPI00248B376D|nr:hypothetical protein [Mycolicibacterium neoaurum]WBP94213.1 hypothetical protein O7W24_24330 [Mycolicibacterium neoaurum]WBS05980.1 hypothetical protein O6072_13825 [Mycolicibacterium neoaurum]
MSDDGASRCVQGLRGLLPVLGAVALWVGVSCGAAHAADDDDDDGSAKSSRTTDSSTRSGSDIEMWPPTTIGWPPFLPDGEPPAGPIVPVGSPP